MELILSIAALTKGLTTVVAMSLLGSVLSNLLLVLGARLTSCAPMWLMAALRRGFVWRTRAGCFALVDERRSY